MPLTEQRYEFISYNTGCELEFLKSTEHSTIVLDLTQLICLELNKEISLTEQQHVFISYNTGCELRSLKSTGNTVLLL
jgi:hypothetical protein